MRPELAITGKLLTRTAQAPFRRQEVLIRYGEREEWSAGKLVVTKLPVEIMSDEQGPSESGREKSEVMKRKKTVNRKNQWIRFPTKRERTTTKPQ